MSGSLSLHGKLWTVLPFRWDLIQSTREYQHTQRPFASEKSLWLPVFNLLPLHPTKQERGQPTERKDNCCREATAGIKNLKSLARTRQGSQTAGPGGIRPLESLLPYPVSKMQADPKSSYTAVLRISPSSLAKVHWPGISDLAPASLMLQVPHLLMPCSLRLGPRFSLCPPGMLQPALPDSASSPLL